jgi:hypothetical protein
LCQTRLLHEWKMVIEIQRLRTPVARRRTESSAAANCYMNDMGRTKCRVVAERRVKARGEIAIDRKSVDLAGEKMFSEEDVGDRAK